ncbi:MAG: flagellar hook protein FlgE [Desulfosalsimonas sp.]
MGLGGAMNSGISGMQAFSNAMSVIGDNLSNTDTAGYKAGRSLFSDLIPDTVSGSGGTSQIGRGAGLSTVDNIFSQGSIEDSSSELDLAIEGSGFFIVRDPEQEGENYTRAGGFRLDSDGYLSNPEGKVVQGYASKGDGEYEDLTSDIQINTRSSVPGEASTEVDLTTNLNSESDERTWDLENPDDNSNFSTTSEVYDSLGNTHQISTYFNKTDDNQWEYHITVPEEEIENGEGNPNDSGKVEVASGELGFNDSGELEEINPDADGQDTITPEDGSWPKITIADGNLDWNNGSDQNQSLDYEMDITQFSTDSKVVSQDADGYSSGYLNDVSVDKDGVITGSYSNGKTRDLSRLALGKFANENGLERLGNNLYRATNSSGPADVGTPGSESGLGEISSNSLEQSTVDIAQEFTKMIENQRSFQANSKTISTTDEMLQEVINIKR